MPKTIVLSDYNVERSMPEDGAVLKISTRGFFYYFLEWRTWFFNNVGGSKELVSLHSSRYLSCHVYDILLHSQRAFDVSETSFWVIGCFPWLDFSQQ